MDKILNCAMYKNDCYIITKNGDAYRIYFNADPYPNMERIPDKNIKEVKTLVERINLLNNNAHNSRFL